jgi:hypothetical protein
MPRKRHTGEETVAEPRQVDVLTAQISMNTRRKVPCEGMPFGRARKVSSQARLPRP